MVVVVVLAVAVVVVVAVAVVLVVVVVVVVVAVAVISVVVVVVVVVVVEVVGLVVAEVVVVVVADVTAVVVVEDVDTGSQHLNFAFALLEQSPVTTGTHPSVQAASSFQSSCAQQSFLSVSAHFVDASQLSGLNAVHW